ncbi:MAG: 30S ribosomal protein S6 [Candidatus Marinimicrobia bacterium]|nr:30S ribosomal protein S6 [Candidatus Neomarinimicrobiota bacterium]MBL7108976.1 30S ribosomal protein S6 [Candidatus Neomarinimicrobiota bacterium]
MKYYETMVIIHPALEKGHLKDNVVNVQDNIQKYGGDVVSTEIWGKKRLAYYVEKQKYGTFTLFQYSGEKVNLNEFNVDLEHDTNILAYMTIRIEENEIREQKEDLDAQIDGRSKTPVVSENIKKQSDEDKTKPKVEAQSELVDDTKIAELAPIESAEEPEKEDKKIDTETDEGSTDPITTVQEEKE